MSVSTTTGEPRACVVCLSCLNEGRALGVWLHIEDAAVEADASIGCYCEGGDPCTHITYGGQGEAAKYPSGALYVACKRCGGDEWEMADWEYLPPSLRTVRGFYELAQEWAALDDPEALYIFAKWYDPAGKLSVSELVTAHEDRYCGEWDSFRDYAEQYAEDTGDLAAMPEHLARYIDWDAYARDLEHDYYYDGGHVWRSY
jgi:antirestriction protein